MGELPPTPVVENLGKPRGHKPHSAMSLRSDVGKGRHAVAVFRATFTVHPASNVLTN